MLATAGLRGDRRSTIAPNSAEIVESWLPGVSKYIASATIEARRGGGEGRVLRARLLRMTRAGELAGRSRRGCGRSSRGGSRRATSTTSCRTCSCACRRGLAALRDEERFAAWLFQIARSAIAEHGRMRARHPLADGVAARTGGGAEPTTTIARPRGRSRGASRCSWRSLPSPYREAVTLVELEGVTTREAADMVGISVSGMKSRVQRGREQLRRLFEQCCEIAVDARGKADRLHAAAEAVPVVHVGGQRRPKRSTMMIPGEITKKGSHYSAIVDLLGAYGQGRTREAACETLAAFVRDMGRELGAGEDTVYVEATDAVRLVSILLREQRSLREMSLADVADAMGVASRNAYAKYEQARAEPSITALQRLLDVIAPELVVAVVPRTAAIAQRWDGPSDDEVAEVLRDPVAAAERLRARRKPAREAG